MLSPCKQPDPICRNPSTPDEPDRKPLLGAVIGLSIHVVMVALIEHSRSGNGFSSQHDKDHGHESGADNVTHPFTSTGPQVQHKLDDFTVELILSSPCRPFTRTKELPCSNRNHSYKCITTQGEIKRGTIPLHYESKEGTHKVHPAIE